MVLLSCRLPGVSEGHHETYPYVPADARTSRRRSARLEHCLCTSLSSSIAHVNALNFTTSKLIDYEIALTTNNLLAYADDIVITAENENDLKIIYRTLKTEAEKVGLIINSTKSKYLLISRNDKDSINNLIIDNIFIESLKEFCYL